ncbi:hypothetical protein [Rhodohalobacter halophilus]|uniref:hypothetical protein n=1 Tax=Rhodohalobacter halophilus TaxID=1812810 RepID=UPI00083FCEAF|nr:hypothetical protein [Rhodohalobacter halophilus]
MENREKFLRNIWLWSLLFFLLAALTGLAYRWGLFTGDSFNLRLSNIRHAHSHLMFFNWVTPVPMGFIAFQFSKSVPELLRPMKWSIGTIMAIGFLSYPFFLLYGYHPVPVGSAELPFSVMLSGLVMIGWYWFGWLYLKYRNRVEKTLSLIFFDGALVMLVVSSMGAWGVAVAQFGNIDNNLISGALTHFFLTTFTEGWCILTALGVIYYFVEGDIEVPFDRNWLIAPIVLGAPLMFPFGLNVELLNESLLWTAKAGSLLVAMGLGVNFWFLIRALSKKVSPVWMFVFALLAIKVMVQLAAVFLPATLWLGQHGLRVFYLHLLLLGFVSTLYFVAIHSVFLKSPKIGLYLFVGSVLLLLSTLVLISGLWPMAWQPVNVYFWVTVGAALPSLAVLVELVLMYSRSDLQQIE